MPYTQAQARYAAVICHGNTKGKPSMSEEVACEMSDKMRGHKMSELPARASHPGLKKMMARRKRSI